MPSFSRLEIWTETSAGSGARVASFDRHDLASCVLKQSLTGAESLTFAIDRNHDAVAELVSARIARVCYSDSTLDTEWRLAEDTSQSGASDRGQVSWMAQALLLDLARAPYFTFDSAGRPTFEFSATQLTATQWLAYVVTACTAAPLPYTVAVGTVDFTNTFDLDGDFQNALEIIRAIQQPGRAPGDFLFRRNGSTDYKLDLLTSRGSSATTVRVQTKRNLLENVRTRTLVNLGTKIVPRAQQGAAVRDLSQVIWRVQTVVSGTQADLEDPYGGADPIAFDDQLNGLYVARVASTFSSQAISDCTQSNSRITVADTTGWTAGDFVRLFRESGSDAERVVSLSHPTRVVSPASGGYGPVTRILDMPAAVGDTNLVKNPWMSTWTTAGNPPDDWGRSSTLGGTWSREATQIKYGTYSQKIANSVTGGTVETTRVYSPTATPYTTSGLRFSAHAWVYVETVSAAVQRWIRVRIMKPDLSESYADGDYLDPASIVGAWTKISVSNADLTGATGGVVVVVETFISNPGSYAFHTSYVDAVALGEADVPISDVLFSGAIPMWQRANTLLSAISSPVSGYKTRIADLARIDDSPWGDEPIVLGGSWEVVDSDLGDTTTQRVMEVEQDLLNPLAAEVQLQTPDPLLTNAIVASAGGSTISGSTGVPVVTGGTNGVRATTLAGYGITDAYTKNEIDTMVAEFRPLREARLWTLRTTPTNLMRGIAWGNDIFAIVCASGTLNRVITSTDGAYWKNQTTPDSNNWQAVCFGGGLFVAVSSSGTGTRVMTSPDGVTWTSRTSAADRTWVAVCYGSSLYVAVAQSGTGDRVMTSPDGITWTSRTSAADNSWNAVCYGNSLYVAVSTDGTNRVMTSPNGTAWTIRATADDSSVWRDVAYGNGRFVAVGALSSSTYNIMTSFDGTTWTGRVTDSTLSLYGITFANGVFCALASDGITITSTDGIAWTRQRTPATFGYRVAASPSLFAAIDPAGSATAVITARANQGVPL